MPNERLVARYDALLNKIGATPEQSDEIRWDSVIRSAEHLKQLQFKNIPELSEEDVQANALLLQKYKGIWNARINQLVPGVMAAVRLSFKDVFDKANVNLVLPDEDRTYFGAFPIKSFNAHSISTDDGYLILVNAGLMEALSALCRIQSTSRFAISGEMDFDDAVETAARFALGMTVKYEKQWSFAVINDTISVPQLDDNQLTLNEAALQAMLVFVVGHEIAHTILKHHKSESGWAIVRHKWIDRVENADWKAELAADLVATDILLNWTRTTLLNSGVQDQRWAYDWLAISSAAPIFYFDCERLILSCSECPKNDSAVTHPPAVMRQAFILDFLKHSLRETGLLQATAPHRQFVRRVRRRTAEWQQAGTLLTQVEIQGGSELDFAQLLIDVMKTPEFSEYTQERARSSPLTSDSSKSEQD